ncbi:MAG: hypothetical protein LBR07_06440 [Puniceicoccales bacterium]|jgi:hypothetical protein|nr:hypothetical protein [Puniceicoccales bacterium]
MRKLLSLLIVGAAGTLFAGTPAHAAPTSSEIIAKARSRVASEKALNAVQAITFEGKITLFGEKLPAEGKSGYVQIDYKKPGKRREYRLDAAAGVESVTAFNGLEGFTQVTQLRSGRKQLGGIQPAVKNSFSDLYDIDTGFFAEPPKGSVRTAGEALQKQTNKPAYVLEYTYRNGTIARRFFDKSTGVLLAQELYRKDAEGKEPDESKRAVLVDEGEIKTTARILKPAAPGAPKDAKPEFENVEFTFPKTTTTYVGGKKVSVLEYSAVRVNGLVLDVSFNYPMP